jgi:hypothetical protein
VAEGAPLLRAYTLIAYRGFESLALRHNQTPQLRGFFMSETTVWKQDARADAYMDVGGRAKQDARADAYMDVVGRAN